VLLVVFVRMLLGKIVGNYLEGSRTPTPPIASFVKRLCVRTKASAPNANHPAKAG
jgi:hypothetical protein